VLTPVIWTCSKPPLSRPWPSSQSDTIFMIRIGHR